MIMHHFSDFRARKNTRKNMVFHSRNFPLLYVTVEEYLIISITFTFNFYFLCIAVHELPAFIITVYNFLVKFPYFISVQRYTSNFYQ